MSNAESKLNLVKGGVSYLTPRKHSIDKAKIPACINQVEVHHKPCERIIKCTDSDCTCKDNCGFYVFEDEGA